MVSIEAYLLLLSDVNGFHLERCELHETIEDAFRAELSVSNRETPILEDAAVISNTL